MLERLLSLLGQGGVHSYADLARQLDVSEELLEQMLQDLARMGYLRPVANGCEAHCAGCTLAETCAIGGPTRVWTLTFRKPTPQIERSSHTGNGVRPIA
ncbi:MAG: FeoC-like transcriptional regulator [Anaerolineae bacterium]|nr:FeoC-like transcriptional regulator [Anaerolineae bacterium]